VKLTDLDNPRILIVRLSAIGDVVFASPLIHALRLRYPAAYLCWLAQPETKALLEHHCELDEVIVWPKGEWEKLWRERRWRQLWKAILSFKRQLRNYQFDLAFDVQGLIKSGMLTWLSGAPQRIGLGSREGSQWLMNRSIPKGGVPQRIGSEYHYFAQRIGLPVTDFEMKIGLSEQDHHNAEQWVASQQLSGGFVVICPFTTRPQKHWFNAGWRDLIDRINQQWGWPVVMLGGPGDQALASEIATPSKGGLFNRVGETSLRQAAAMIAQASLVVGVDTGLTHIGIAMNRPTLCLFGATCPYLDTTHDNAQVIYYPRLCSPCKRHPTCQGAFDCMADIQAAEIMIRASRLPGFEAPLL
jgi:heptosyltransferase-1